MAVQKTLLDGDTGGKFSSLELLAGAVAEGGLPVGTTAGSVLTWDGTAWVENPQNSVYTIHIGRILAPGTDPLLLGSGSEIAETVDPGVGNKWSVSAPLGQLKDTSGNIFYQWQEGVGQAWNGEAAIARPVVVGAKGGNVALANLLTALADLGLITDNTT